MILEERVEMPTCNIMETMQCANEVVGANYGVTTHFLKPLLIF